MYDPTFRVSTGRGRYQPRPEDSCGVVCCQLSSSRSSPQGRLSERRNRLHAGAAPPAVRVFVDCPSGCDSTYIRKELNFVDHVRDREVADVHILITAERAGGGGETLHHQLHGPPRVRRDQ